LVPGGKQERAGAVGDGHEDRAPDAGLYVLERYVAGTGGRESVEHVRETREVRAEHRLDGNFLKPNAKIFCELPRVAPRTSRRAEHRARETAFSSIVPGAEHERPVGGLFVRVEVLRHGSTRRKVANQN